MDQDMRKITWRKSSYSGPNNDDCVELANAPSGGWAVRDSKNPNGPILTFTSAEWTSFLLKIKTGEVR